MAARPWVAPEEIKAYTDIPSVAARSSDKLAIDISRAEQYVISYTNCDFSDDEKFPDIPENVKLAVLLMAEYYAQRATVSKDRLMKSETYNIYSYTVADSDEATMLSELGLGSLLDEYVVSKGDGRVVMKLRRL